MGLEIDFALPKVLPFTFSNQGVSVDLSKVFEANLENSSIRSRRNPIFNNLVGDKLNVSCDYSLVHGKPKVSSDVSRLPLGDY